MIPRRSKGFRQTGAILSARIRKAGESRGFAVSRLLTRWAEVAGPDLSQLCQPVKVGYGRTGLGATLTVLTTGAKAPLVEMQKDALRQRVNACYGYNAISRIHITQTAPAGFAEPPAAYDPGSGVADPDATENTKAVKEAEKIADDGLRQALEALGRKVLTRPKNG